MKRKAILIFAIIGLLFTSCSEDDVTSDSQNTETPDEENDEQSVDYQVKDFVYRGLNNIYLYKANVPELADDYFSAVGDKEEYLESYSSPEDLFEDLLSSEDRFSYIVEDYNDLEDQFNGVSGATGIEFGLGLISETSNVFGYIQYVLPNTSAATEGLDRGTVFTEINGEQLNTSNYTELLALESFTINIGYIENGTIYLTDKTAYLTDDPYTMNPVYISEVLEMEGHKIGYLMYNSFIADFDDELNMAFGDFKSEGVTDLILDLRYNGGGSVTSAVNMASMITGQFNSEIFATQKWNEDYQEYYETYSPEDLINRFNSEITTGEAINSLNLNEVYILTTQSTASASELVINGLNPYINVVHIGETTTGKFQASVTLYDSPAFDKEDVNEAHTYAMQPLVLKMANANGYTDYTDGLTPDIELEEDLNDLGILGDPDELYLSRALDEILGRTQIQSKSFSEGQLDFRKIGESKMLDVNYQKMYIDLPPATNN